MATFIGFNREDEAIEWAKQRIGNKGQIGFCRALSLVDDHGDFLFVVVLSNFSKRNIDLHQAAKDGAKWATPKAFIDIFNATFHYAFTQLNVARVTGLVKANNVRARIFNQHLGLRLEGIMRNVFEDDDLYLYGFLKNEFEQHKWFRG